MIQITINPQQGTDITVNPIEPIREEPAYSIDFASQQQFSVFAATHQLALVRNIRVQDVTGEVVQATIRIADNQDVTVTFSSPQSGRISFF